MSASARQTVEIELLGQKIVLKSSGEDPELIREVVALASERLKIARQRSGKGAVAPHHVALLALLDMAEEYVRARKRSGEYRKAVLEKSERLKSLIESELK